MSDDAAGPQRPDRRGAWIWLACAASCALALVYGLAPFTYTYFRQAPFFQYSQYGGRFIARTYLASAYEAAWGHVSAQAFVNRDVTCQLRTAQSDAEPGCAHLLRSGGIVYGPYITLPKGAYRVHYVIEAPHNCENPIQADVVAMDATKDALAVARFRSGGAVDLNIDLRIDSDVGRSGHVEFRTLQTAGPACATLKRIQVRRLGS